MKRQTESVIRSQIIKYLRQAGGVVLAIPNELVRLARRRVSGIVAGSPDLVVVLGGQIFFIEVKSPKGRLSPAQKALHEQIRAQGGQVCVARSVKDVELFLSRFRIFTQTDGANTDRTGAAL